LPSLLSIYYGGYLRGNENLNELDLSSWEKMIYNDFDINQNNNLELISLDSFFSVENDNKQLNIYDNSILKTITFGTNESLDISIRIFRNPSLENVTFLNLKNVKSGIIELESNEFLKEIRFPELVSSNYFKEKNYWQEPELRISEKSLETIFAPKLENFFKIRLRNNPSISEITFPELITIHKFIEIRDNANLSKIAMPKLKSTGDKFYNENSFSIYSNQTLNDINFNSLHKVYTSLTVENNQQLDLNDFPCNLFVLVNDGLDCTFGDINVSNNLDDSYCFQDPSLIPPIDIQTVAAFNISSEQAQSGGTITSFTKMKSRGVVWSTSPNPTIENDFFSENGSLNGSYDSYMYNLQPDTTYYFRAYGEDCNGVFYGNELQFTTLP
jgi:hypothetical protein